MSAADAFLALYFDAPLQSWGCGSRFDRRTTLSHPTRSGVLGMLCAALGIDRNDTAGLARLAPLRIAVVTLRRRGRMEDYHTVGGGYDAKRDRLCICRTAAGKVGTTVQTWREYLEDDRHGAVAGATRPLIEEIAAALANPRWGVWLGRKACIPASPVLQGVFDAEEQALAKLRRIAGTPDTGRITVIRDAASFAEGDDTLMDVPLDFSHDARRFAPRRVSNRSG